MLRRVLLRPTEVARGADSRLRLQLQEDGREELLREGSQGGGLSLEIATLLLALWLRAAGAGARGAESRLRLQQLAVHAMLFESERSQGGGLSLEIATTCPLDILPPSPGS